MTTKPATHKNSTIHKQQLCGLYYITSIPYLLHNLLELLILGLNLHTQLIHSLPIPLHLRLHHIIRLIDLLDIPIEVHDAHDEVVDFHVHLLVGLFELVHGLDLLLVLFGGEVVAGVHHFELLGVGVDLFEELGF